MKKTAVLSYVGLTLCALGWWLATVSDPDLLIFAIPLLISGVVLFVENLKQSIADAVSERLTGQVDADSFLTKQPPVAPHRDNGLAVPQDLDHS